MIRRGAAVFALVLVVAAVAVGAGAAAPTPADDGSAADQPGSSLASGLGTTEASLDGTYRAATYRVRLAEADSRAALEAVLADIADELERDVTRLSAEDTAASTAEARYRRALRGVEAAMLARMSEQLAGVADGSETLRARFDRLASEAETLSGIDAASVNVSIEIDVDANVTTSPALSAYGGLNASTIAELRPSTRAELERVLSASGAESLADLTASDMLSMDAEAALELVDAGLIDLADYEGLDRATLENATVG